MRGVGLSVRLGPRSTYSVVDGLYESDGLYERIEIALRGGTLLEEWGLI